MGTDPHKKSRTHDEDYVPFSDLSGIDQSQEQGGKGLSEGETVGVNPHERPDETPPSTPPLPDTRLITPHEEQSAGEPRMSDTAVTQAVASDAQQKPQKQAEVDPKQSDQLIGKTLQGFIIKSKLGEGGMGSVYRARQKSLSRDVALKILPAHMTKNPAFIARFIREALTAAHLNHHHVIQVFDVGVVNSIHYIAMEFVKGQSLGDLIRQKGKLEEKDAVRYVLQAARGLAYAHKRGLIHRDIKPDNLLINEHDMLKIADMGLAKIKDAWKEETIGLTADSTALENEQAFTNLTNIRSAMGTPAYMAPEQGQDAKDVDYRADQYALGCTLYYILTGQTPFHGKTSHEIISKHLTEPIPPLESHQVKVSGGLRDIFLKMTAKIPSERYQDPGELVRDLEECLEKLANASPEEQREALPPLQSLSEAAHEYHNVSFLKFKPLSKLLFFIGCIVALFVSRWMGLSQIPAASILMLMIVPVLVFAIRSWSSGDILFTFAKRRLYEMRLNDYLILTGLILVSAIFIYAFRLALPLAIFIPLALVLSLLYTLLIHRRIKRLREPAVRKAEAVIDNWRRRGMSESKIQERFRKECGNRWQECFIDCFGYEQYQVYLQYTKKSGVIAQLKYRPLYALVYHWATEYENAREREEEEQQIRQAEYERLVASGKNAQEAEEVAYDLAKEAMEETLPLDSPQLLRQEIDEIGLELHRSGKSKVLSGFKIAYRLVHVSVALTMICLALLALLVNMGQLTLPPFAQTLLEGYGALGYGLHLFGLLSGLCLLLLSFSSHLFICVLSVICSMVLVSLNVLLSLFVGEDSLFAERLSLWASFMAVPLLLILAIFARLTGGRY